MAIILGIESTAHTFGIGIVKDGKILANQREMYTTEEGGIIPMESAKHHAEIAGEVYERALAPQAYPDKSSTKISTKGKAGIDEKEIDAIAFSQGPGLAPCLLEGMKFAKMLSKKLNKPIIPVNHCVAHLEVGAITGAKDPVMLYTSGANTQIIAYEAGKYRIFGETLDVGVGNFIDNFARLLGIGFPGGPKIEKLAQTGNTYIELPYKVKGMDIALSGILTNLKQKIASLQSRSELVATHQTSSRRSTEKLIKGDKINNKSLAKKSSEADFEAIHNQAKRVDYTPADLAFSMQETVFAMLVETAERALAHTGKKELLLGGGVACNARLQEMCKIMCEERGAKFFVPERPLLVDNAAMIAFLGEIMFSPKIKQINLDKIDIHPRERTDDVNVDWK
jgi:N6-L-threonylcarbamoyladenine synthase